MKNKFIKEILIGVLVPLQHQLSLNNKFNKKDHLIKGSGAHKIKVSGSKDLTLVHAEHASSGLFLGLVNNCPHSVLKHLLHTAVA